MSPLRRLPEASPGITPILRSGARSPRGGERRTARSDGGRGDPLLAPEDATKWPRLRQSEWYGYHLALLEEDGAAPRRQFDVEVIALCVVDGAGERVAELAW